MKKTFLLLNAFWIAATAGAFAIGYNLSKPSGAARGSTPTVVATSISAEDPGSMVTRQKMPKATSALTSLIESQPSWMAKGALSPFEMERAVADLVLETDPLQRNLQFSLLMQKLTPDNAEAAFTTMREKSTGWEMRRNMSLLAYAWGTVDAPAALEKFAEQGGRESTWMKGSVVSGWASKDADAAVAWVEAVDNKEERGSYTWGLISGLARMNPGRATDYVSNIEDSGQRSRYIGMIAEQKLKEGVDSATNWVRGLSDSGMKAGALDNIARNYVNRDPEAAAKWVEQFATTDFGERAIGEVAEELAEAKGSTAAEWAAELPEGKARAAAFSEVFKEWARQDPAAASESLVAMPNSPSKDRAVSALTREIANDDPAGAITWAQTIEDDDLRVASLVRSGQGLYRQDPETALAWAAEALPADQVDKIKGGGNEGRRWDWRR